jgi:hypothetical protein
MRGARYRKPLRGRFRRRPEPTVGAPAGGPERIRTSDTRFRKPLLYPLSYGAGRRPHEAIGSGQVSPTGNLRRTRRVSTG